MLYRPRVTIIIILIPITKDRDSINPPATAPRKFDPKAIFLCFTREKEVIKIIPAKKIGKFSMRLAKIDLGQKSRKL